MSDISDSIKEFVTYNVSKLVDTPEEVKVEVSVSTKTIIVQIYVNQSDCGKVIGKQGRTIESLKILTLAMKNTGFFNDNRQIALEIIEDENSTYNRKTN
jgi:predicted RNA-binding protein YlqC (UPF0109 family)